MKRTNTTDRNLFTLPYPDHVTFDFSSSTPCSAIHITIEPGGKWRMPLHWHRSDTGGDVLLCQSITNVSGHLHVYTAKGISGGCNMVSAGSITVNFEPDQRVAWGNYGGPDEGLKVNLVADHNLWRNICSSILDRDIFPQLSSTPLWLKAVFAILRLAPSLKDGLLSFMLWIQLQSIFFSHGFHVYHGRVPFTWPWMCQPFGGRSPLRAKEWALKSQYLIS